MKDKPLPCSVQKTGRNLYSVASESQYGKAYVVEVHPTSPSGFFDAWLSCTCADFTFRARGNDGYACKHIDRVFDVYGFGMEFEPEPVDEQPLPTAKIDGMQRLARVACANNCGGFVVICAHSPETVTIQAWCSDCARKGILVAFA